MNFHRLWNGIDLFHLDCQSYGHRVICVSLVCVYAHSVVSDSLWPKGLQPRQTPLSMEFSRQEYWSGLPFPSPGDLPYPRIKSASPALAGGFFTTAPPGKLPVWIPYYPFTIFWVCSDITSSIPNTGNLCLFYFCSLSVFLEVCLFLFQRMSFWFHWFFSILLLFSISLVSALYYFLVLCLLWFYYVLFS